MGRAEVRPFDWLVWMMLPRKNGKSELAAALAVYFLLFDGEMGAQVYSAAWTEQSETLARDERLGTPHPAWWKHEG